MLKTELLSLTSLSWPVRFLARVAAADPNILSRCPQTDIDTVSATAWLMLLAAIYQTALFWSIGEKLFSSLGKFDPIILLVAAFIALFILKIDALTVIRSGWHLNGISELKRGGLDISGGPMARVKAAFQLIVRIVLAVGIAQLTAVFVSLLIFGKDIEARIDSDTLRANAPLIATVTERIDAGIRNQREAIVGEVAQAAKVEGEGEALRKRELDVMATEPKLRDAQDEVARLSAVKSKADDELQDAESFAINEAAGIKGAPNNSGQVGEGIRFRAANERVANAKARVAEVVDEIDQARIRVKGLEQQFAARVEASRRQIQEQRASVDKSISDAKLRLAALNAQLERLVSGRDAAIQTAVTGAPDYVARKDGLLIQISALRSIADGSPEVGLVILLIEVTSFGFELAAVLSKVLSYTPTAYATYIARDFYVFLVGVVDAMSRELNLRTDTEQDDPAEVESDDDDDAMQL